MNEGEKMAFKIGSINMYKFSYQKDDEIAKELDKIISLIKEEEFDIIALQEVLNEASVKNMIRQMPNWDYVWQAPTSRSQQAAEGYAFIWNTKRFRIATSQTKEEKNAGESNIYRSFTPRIHSNYNPDNALFKGKLIRDPLYARFESIYGWYELRLINTHIMYRDNKKEDDEGDKEKRRRELEILIGILHQIETKQYRNNRTAYTFLLGDYNLSIKDIKKLKDIALETPNEIEAIKTISERDGSKEAIITVQHELSTLKAPSKKQPDVPVDGYANNYDHFTYNEKIRNSRKVNLHCERIDSVNKYWSGDFQNHRKEFSDHTPIKLTGEFK